MPHRDTAFPPARCDVADVAGPLAIINAPFYFTAVIIIDMSPESQVELPAYAPRSCHCRSCGHRAPKFANSRKVTHSA